MKIDSADLVYKKYYNKQYQAFILSDTSEFSIRAPAPTTTPWNAISSEKDWFTKETCAPDAAKGKVHFIKKNEKNYALLWETKAETLKAGVRWGIIKAESITGQVISTLGHYRIIAHERIVHENKLMVSNTQALKLALLDVFQDRFELMQNLESLVNTSAPKANYERDLSNYIAHLEGYKNSVRSKFSGLNLEGLNYNSLPDKIIADLDEDIKNAKLYWQQLEQQETTRYANRARGSESILDFVKRQMQKNLYEFQGLNQDVVFAIGAFTRGEMNNLIADASDLIDKHKPDLRNAVNAKHHGLYASTGQTLVYDFGQANLSPAEEKQALIAISFIEGWDRVDYTSDWMSPRIINQSNPEQPSSAVLEKIFATKWNTHRNFGAAFIHYLANWFKGIIYPTQPWEGEGDTFKTYAAQLLAQSKPFYPMWMKGWHLLKTVGTILKDTVKGIRNFGKTFTLYLRLDMQNDWASSKKLPLAAETFAEANQQIALISSEELKILKGLEAYTSETFAENPQKILAQSDYHLSYGEEHDLLIAMVQGIGGFSGHFTHNLFTKDPVGALIFSSAFMVGGVSIFFPMTAKTFLGSQFVNGFNQFAGLVGSSTLSKAACGSLSLAQGVHLAWGLTEGPSSEVLHAMQAIIEDPLSAAFLFSAAYGIGYALAHVPVLGDYIREELGSSDVLNYPVIGVKLGVGGVLVLVSNDSNEPISVEIPYNSEKLARILQHLQGDPLIMREVGLMMQRLEMVQWLAKHAPFLAKLNFNTQFDLERQIDTIFTREQALSLKKLIYPEKDRSVAYQVLAVPFGYIPALVRLGASAIMSAVAWFINNPKPAEPVKQAAEALVRKMAKDITRIYNITANALYIAVNIAFSPFKTFALLTTMLIGRLSAFIELPTGHFMHKGFWFVHNIYCRIGEFLAATRPMKSVVFADPMHTINEVVQSIDCLVEESYAKINLGQVKKVRSQPEVLIEDAKRYQFSHKPKPGLEVNLEPLSLESSEINVQAISINF
ncbi:MAG: hypothetical protein H0U70_01685 [Tatlockia sp.]|nr:hypothetical protein [Tatlockia sp.]